MLLYSQRRQAMKAYVNDLDTDTITVQDYNGIKHEYSIQKELEVDESNYQKAFIEQPAKYAFWSAVLQEAKLVLKQQEDLLERKHAECYNKAYQKYLEEGIRPTKDLLEAQIALDPAYQEAQNRVNTADYSMGRVQFIVKVFEQRAQMLISYGADKRQENNYGN